MSINDPGWGDGGLDDGVGGGDGWGGSGGEPPKQRPVWMRTPYLAGGGLVLLVVLVVVLVVVLGGNGKSKNADKNTPIPTSSGRSSSATSAAPSPTTSQFTIADYATKADAICTTYKPQLAAAENQSLAALVEVATGELQAIEALGSPDTDAAQQHTWLQQVTVAFTDLQAGNVNAYNTDIVTADTTAGNIGMKVCNYGY